jgi:hypothetical protein
MTMKDNTTDTSKINTGNGTSNGVSPHSLTASATKPANPIEEFRRQQADRAIAKIEERYRRGLSIPDVR